MWSFETGVAETPTYFSLLLRVELNFNQTLRQQQDQAYLESLRADQEKERRRCEERERREGEARQQREKELEEQYHREVCVLMIMSYISVLVNEL
jgi:FAS-associated factor 2